MKNMKRIIGVAVLSFTLCMTSVSAHAATRKYVTADSLNVRTAPYIGDNVIKPVGYRNYVTVTGTDGDWTEIVMADGRIGFVSTDYLSEKQPPIKTTAKAVSSKGKYLGSFEITFYTPDPSENGGYACTALGTSFIPWRTAAVDTRVIPLGTTIYVEGYGTFRAEDTGGAIKGNRLDLCVSSHAEANRLGRVKGVSVYSSN